jgi:hypothetical protein
MPALRHLMTRLAPHGPRPPASSSWPPPLHPASPPTPARLVTTSMRRWQQILASCHASSTRVPATPPPCPRGVGSARPAQPALAATRPPPGAGARRGGVLAPPGRLLLHSGPGAFGYNAEAQLMQSKEVMAAEHQLFWEQVGRQAAGRGAVPPLPAGAAPVVRHHPAAGARARPAGGGHCGAPAWPGDPGVPDALSAAAAGSGWQRLAPGTLRRRPARAVPPPTAPADQGPGRCARQALQQAPASARHRLHAWQQDQRPAASHPLPPTLPPRRARCWRASRSRCRARCCASWTSATRWACAPWSSRRAAAGAPTCPARNSSPTSRCSTPRAPPCARHPASP